MLPFVPPSRWAHVRPLPPQAPAQPAAVPPASAAAAAAREPSPAADVLVIDLVEVTEDTTMGEPVSGQAMGEEASTAGGEGELRRAAVDADDRAAEQESQLHSLSASKPGRDMGEWLGIDHGVSLQGALRRGVAGRGVPDCACGCSRRGVAGAAAAAEPAVEARLCVAGVGLVAVRAPAHHRAGTGDGEAPPDQVRAAGCADPAR
jgi:hypothetical protein